MNTKTMEGLVGASSNMELFHTPMRVYKEARSRGDTATMERAMGYAGQFAERAEEYKAKASEGLEEETRAAREKEKLEREEAARKRREEGEKLDGMSDGSKSLESDIVEISEEGKALLKEKMSLESGISDEAGSTEPGDMSSGPVGDSPGAAGKEEVFKK